MGKGKVTNSQPQQNTSQNVINPEEAVKLLYRVMLAWGEAVGAKDAINVAFKNAGINEDQIGSVQPSPVASGFETAAATLRHIHESFSEGSLNVGDTQRHASDLLQTLSHTAGLTIQGAGVE
ncbi:alpha/beta hydrolase [Sesbania bispinosa]|nr:alpha/beta hydrolase [Sesbania bispinosa]